MWTSLWCHRSNCDLFPMANFALQGTHPSTGSGRRQVCDVFTMSLVEHKLMGFLWLLSLCRPGTLRLTGVVSTAHPRTQWPL